MNKPLTHGEFIRLDARLPSTITLSMLDGYLAAVASGPNFVMPDQILQWVSDAGSADVLATSLIIRHYQAVIDALNDQVYVPNVTDPQAWCRGYLTGFAAEMTAWAPLSAAQPGLLKVIMAGAGGEGLADAARRIHAFWAERRRTGADGGGVLEQQAAFLPGHAAQPTQRPH